MRYDFSRPEPVAARTGAAGLVARFASAASAGLIIPVFAPLGLLTNAALRRLFLAVIVLGISFPVGRQFGYREDAGSLGSLGGLPVSLGTIALIGLYVPLLLRGRPSALAGLKPSSHPSLPLMLYFAFAALSLLAAEDTALAAYELFLLFQLLLLHFYIVSWVTSQKEILFLFRLLLVGLAAQGLLMIGLAAAPAMLSRLGSETRVEDDSDWVTRHIQIAVVKARVDENATKGAVRVGGAVGSPNDAAGYLSASLAVALGIIIASVGRRDRLLAGLALSTGGIALILTLSRGGWIAFALDLAIIAFASLRTRRVSRKALMALAVILALFGVFFYGVIASRITGEDEGAAGSRFPLIKLAALIIEDHPLLGVGANNFPIAMEPYLTQGFSGQFIYTVHNKYLLVWSETGLGALLAFLWFLFATLGRGVRCWRYRHPVLSPLALGCTAGIAGQMLHMSVDIFRGPPTMQLLSLIAALVAVLERLGTDRRRRAGRAVAAPVVIVGVRG